jgi:hypothetical protein
MEACPEGEAEGRLAAALLRTGLPGALPKASPRNLAQTRHLLIASNQLVGCIPKSGSGTGGENECCTACGQR